MHASPQHDGEDDGDYIQEDEEEYPIAEDGEGGIIEDDEGDAGIIEDDEDEASNAAGADAGKSKFRRGAPPKTPRQTEDEVYDPIQGMWRGGGGKFMLSITAPLLCCCVVIALW